MRMIGQFGWMVLFAGILVVLPGATCIPQIVVPGLDDDGGDVLPGGDSEWATQIIELVNSERAANGLEPLKSNAQLAQAAVGHAERMAELGFFEHVDPYNGTEPWDRAGQAGYEWSVIAENLAAGQPTPEYVMNGWMNSPGHRSNILSPEVTEIGVGIYEGGAYGIYWVQLFGHPG